MDESQAALNEAMLLEGDGRWEEAIQQYRHTLQFDPTNMDARHALAGLLAEKHLYNEAAAEYEKVCRLRPDDPTPRILLSQTLIDAGQKKRARVEAEKAMRLLSQLLKQQADTVPQSGTGSDSPESAEQDLRIQDTAETQAEQFFQLGSALYALQRFRDALPWFERAHVLIPDDIAAHYCLGMTLCRLGRLDEAVREFRHVVEDQTWTWKLPEAMKLMMYQARSLRSTALNEEIRDLVRGWMTRQPESIEARCAVAEFEWRCGNQREALDLLSVAERSIPRQADRARDWSCLGSTYWQIRQRMKTWGVVRIAWRYWWVYSVQSANERERDEQNRPPAE